MNDELTATLLMRDDLRWLFSRIMNRDEAIRQLWEVATNPKYKPESAARAMRVLMIVEDEL